jgi:protein O-mannosyl-transferase
MRKLTASTILLRRRGVAAFILAVLAAAVYANTLGNPFVFDDMREVVENTSIVTLTDLAGVLRHNKTRPITNLSYSVDYARSALDPVAYHVTNILLHVINVLLLFSLIRQIAVDLSPDPRPRSERLTLIAFAAAALFAVHPMMTEAVGYVSGRAEVLCATFFLMSFLCFRHSLRGEHHTILAAAAGLGLFLLCLGTKENAVLLPVVLLLYDRLASRSTGAWRARFARVHAPLLLMVLVLAVARMWFYLAVEHAEAAEFSWRNLLAELHVFERYLQLMLLPHPLTMVHRVAPITSLFDLRLVSAGIVLAVTVYTAWVARRRVPLLTFGIAWWYLALIPSAALIVIADTGQVMAEHRVYLASCGLFLAVAGAAQALAGSTALGGPRWRVLAPVALILALGIFSGMTIARNRVWSSEVRLWEDAALKAPRTLAPQQYAGDAHRSAGDCEKAIAFYRRAIEIRPDYADSHYGLAECAIDLRRIEDARLARQGLQKVIAQRALDPRPRMTLARLEETVFRRPGEALRLCREALSLDPELPNAAACVRRIEAAIGGTRR